MDVRRHVTAGRLSEMFGADQVETDTFMRTLGWRRVAEDELALLAPTTRDYLDAYAAGVNAWLATHRGADASLEYAVLGLRTDYAPEPWTPVDSVAWLKAMAWDLQGNMREEIERARAACPAAGGTGGRSSTRPIRTTSTARSSPPARSSSGQFVADDGIAAAAAASAASAVPPAALAGLAAVQRRVDAVPALLGPPGTGLGSNAWAVSGSRTTTGKPLLANDPHLGPSMPSIWYQMGLHCVPRRRRTARSTWPGSRSPVCPAW